MDTPLTGQNVKQRVELTVIVALRRIIIRQSCSYFFLATQFPLPYTHTGV
jgi:hypothetical protein